MIAGLQVAVGGALIDRRNRIAGELHVTFEFGAAVADETGAGLRFLLVSQILQLDHCNAAEQDSEQQNRAKGKQEQFHSQS